MGLFFFASTKHTVALVLFCTAICAKSADASQKMRATNADEPSKLLRRHQHNGTAPTITLTLIDASVNLVPRSLAAGLGDILVLGESSVLDLADLPRKLTIRADTTYTNIEAIVFEHNGTWERTEATPFYLIAGEKLSGGPKKFDELRKLGHHTISAIVLIDGDIVDTHTVHLEIRDTTTPSPTPSTTTKSPSAVTPGTVTLMLVDAQKDRDIRPLVAGDTIHRRIDGKILTVRAECDQPVDAVKFFFDGDLVRVESKAPYTLGGEDGLDYRRFNPIAVPGNHTLKAVAVQVFDNAESDVNTPSSGGFRIPDQEVGRVLVDFRVIDMTNSPVTAPPSPSPSTNVFLTLIDAKKNQDLGALEMGAVVNLNTVGRRLNVRADCAAAGAVDFFLDSVYVRTESATPYSLGGDRANNDYHPYLGMTKLGWHRIEARARLGAVVVGRATVDFEVTDETPVPTFSAVPSPWPTSSPEVTLVLSTVIPTDTRMEPNVSSHPPTSAFEYLTHIFVNAGSIDEDLAFVSPGKTKTYDDEAVLITGDDKISKTVFQTQRYSKKSFTYTVPGFAPYSHNNVTIGFAEIFEPNCQAGARVFDVIVMDTILVSALDVFGTVGCFVGHRESGTFQADSAGKISVTLVPRLENPMVSYMKITTTTTGPA